MAESDFETEELPRENVGARLRRAREASELGLGDIAARTKIAERHLVAIEQGRFGDLASRTYAVGFARAYARAVGLDEAEIAQAVRDELAATDAVHRKPPADVFEPGDPARIPGSRLAWAAGLAALVVIVLLATFWRSFFSPAVSLPDLAAPTASPGPRSPSPTASPVPATSGKAPVVITALEPGIWVKFYDAAGNQLMQKQLALGESYTVPADANGPQLRTGRPDALQITVAGRIVPKLSDRPVNIKDVPVSAAALLARGSPPASTSTPASPPRNPSPSFSSPSPSPSPLPTSATQLRRLPPPEAAPAGTPSPVADSSPAETEPETSTVSN